MVNLKKRNLKGFNRFANRIASSKYLWCQGNLLQDYFMGFKKKCFMAIPDWKTINIKILWYFLKN